MKSKAKGRFSTNATEAWLAFARDDANGAKKLFSAELWNLVCFHAQQAGEKALKAFLRFHTNQVPRVHSLAKLIDLCSKIDRTFNRHKNAALLLDRYYIPTRYPEAAPGSLAEGLPEKNDAQIALKQADRILRFVQKRLKMGQPPLGF
jgi:HEPN domain-containing protein